MGKDEIKLKKQMQQLKKQKQLLNKQQQDLNKKKQILQKKQIMLEKKLNISNPKKEKINESELVADEKEIENNIEVEPLDEEENIVKEDTEEDIEIVDDDIDIITDEDDEYTPYLVAQDKAEENEEDIRAKKMNAFAKEFFSWVKMFLIAVCIAVFLNFVILFNGTVPSGSMSPTIEYPSRIIGLRLAYSFSEPERGDIIIFKYPDDPSQNFIKRIIGLPGETVEIIDGEIYISVDGEMIEDPLDESAYLTEDMTGDFGPYEVPEGCYFVLGDNRDDSKDSRYWTNTYVSEDAILAKAVIQYWPDLWLLN